MNTAQATNGRVCQKRVLAASPVGQALAVRNAQQMCPP
jgi:hypothetical protein